MSDQHKVADINELVKYILFTDYLSFDINRKEVPVSALIIANAESGKTSIIEQFYPNGGLLYANDVTAWGIENRWLKDMQTGKVKRLLIPDLINPVNRKQETVDSLITFLNSYISWEGVRCIMTYAMQIELEEPVRGSLITTITPQDFNRMTKHLAAVGFLSRLLPITYNYSDILVDYILVSILEQRKAWSKIKLDIPDMPQTIKLDVELGKRLIPLSKSIGQSAGAYGFRAIQALIALCKSKALSELRSEVTEGDVERITDLAHTFIRFPKEVKGIMIEAEPKPKPFQRPHILNDIKRIIGDN